MAVFAPKPRSLSYNFAGALIHAYALAADRKAARFCLKKADDLCIVKVCPVFSNFRFRQRAEIGFDAELFDAKPNFVADLLLRQGLRALRSQPSRVWIQQLI